MKKTVTLLLSCALLLWAMLPVAAAEPAGSAQSRYSYISHCTASLSISSQGTALCTGRLSVSGGSSTELLLELYQETDSGWTRLQKWEITGSASFTANKSRNVDSGSTYRLMVYGFVYDSNENLLESAYDYQDADY